LLCLIPTKRKGEPVGLFWSQDLGLRNSGSETPDSSDFGVSRLDKGMKMLECGILENELRREVWFGCGTFLDGQNAKSVQFLKKHID